MTAALRWQAPQALVLLLSATFALAAPPEPPEPLRILAVEEPPASYTGTDGKPAGFAVDVLREIQRRVGNDDPVTIEPETRVYESGLRLPNTVLLSFSRVPEREDSFYWIARIIHKPWVFYARADDPRNMASLDDARNINGIAVVAGDVRARWLKKQGLQNLFVAQSHEQAMRLLLARRVDAVFSEPQCVAWFCHTQKCLAGRPRALWSPRASDVYILMSKRGTAPELALRWQAAATAMAADGTLERIGRHWVEESASHFAIRSVWRGGVLDFCPDSGLC